MSTFMLILLVIVAMLVLIALILLSIQKINRRIIKSEQEKTRILKQSEIKYRTLVDSMEETVVVVDKEGRYHFLHTTIPGLLHLNSSEYIGQTVYDVLPKDTADDMMARVRDVYKTGHSRIDEIEPDIGKGNLMWVSTRLTPQFNTAGEVETVLAVSRDVTEDKETLGLLQESEKKYHLLIDSMQDTVYVLDKTGKILYLNLTKAALEYFNTDEIIGKSVQDLVPKSVSDFILEKVNEVFNTGNSIIDESLANFGIGKPFWVSTRLTPQKDETGKIVSVLGVGRDITKRKKTEELLKNSEKKYHSLVDSMEDTVFVLDNQGYFEFIKTDLPPLKHLNDGDYLGKTIYDLVSKKYADNLMKRVRKVFKTGTSQIGNFQYTFNNKKHWVSTRLTPQLNDTGQTVSVLGVSRNTTQQMEMVDLLIDSESKYRSLVESMEENVFVLDEKGKYHYIHTSIPSLKHLNSSTSDGKSIYDVLPKDSADSIMERVHDVFKTGRSRLDETQLDIGEGRKLWGATRLTPRFNPNGDVISVLGVSSDITKRKEMEIELQDLVKTLKKQRKSLQVLSREVINAQESERQRISHELHDDIGQSLTAISLNLEAINLDVKNETKLKDRIKDSHKLVRKTIDDVHRFSFALRPIIIDDLGLIPAIQSQAENFQKRTGIVVKIKGNKEAENTTNEIKTVLYRVIQEGLNNIAKHSNASAVRIVLGIDGHSISLKISDNGKGFDINQLDQSSETGSQGLQGIEERIQLVGGSLQIQSNSKSGTTLTVKAPYAEA
ncbi:PAS domain-containing protein [Candidatus Neomarinimicrobiota bacterium]